MRSLCVLFAALLMRLAPAQAQETTTLAPVTTITGVVHDSIANTPLSNATVQLVGADPLHRFNRTTISDSLGRFTLDGVPAGRYSLGFFHPILESLGIEPPLRELYVTGQRRIRSDLATPSPERFREAVCGSKTKKTTSESAAVVVGIVRDARDLSAAAGVAVTAEWLEFTFTRQGLLRNLPRLEAITAENGWFAMCDVPSPGTMTLRASRNADSIDPIEVEVPAHGVVRQELFLGPVRAEDAPQRPGTDTSPSQHMRTGDGHLSGTVVSAEAGQPLAGARVGIVAGPQTRANEQGEWTLGNAPMGTRVLEVRSVGYYPERRAVNVIPGGLRLAVRLSTLKSVLDTIKVSANRLRYDRSGFQDRRRTAAGKYLTAADVARRGAFFTADIFRTVPGITLDPEEAGGPAQIRMRGPFGQCSPTIFIDGHRIPGSTAGDVDDWLTPMEIAGIEIYSEATVPPQFRDYARTDVCGSILIWRK